METVVTAIAGIVFNKLLERSGEKLGEAFAPQAGGAIARIANPKAAAALTAGDPDAIDVEVARVVEQQAETDPELRAMLEAMAALVEAEFAREEIAKIKKQIDVSQSGEHNIQNNTFATKIDKQVNVKQEGFGNTQTNTFN